jgi:hypothetical protein
MRAPGHYPGAAMLRKMRAMMESRNVRLEIRLTPEEHANYERQSREEGHPTIASWIRGVCNARVRKSNASEPPARTKKAAVP